MSRSVDPPPIRTATVWKRCVMTCPILPEPVSRRKRPGGRGGASPDPAFARTRLGVAGASRVVLRGEKEHRARPEHRAAPACFAASSGTRPHVVWFVWRGSAPHPATRRPTPRRNLTQSPQSPQRNTGTNLRGLRELGVRKTTRASPAPPRSRETQNLSCSRAANGPTSTRSGLLGLCVRRRLCVCKLRRRSFGLGIGDVAPGIAFW